MFHLFFEIEFTVLKIEEDVNILNEDILLFEICGSCMEKEFSRGSYMYMDRSNY